MGSFIYPCTRFEDVMKVDYIFAILSAIISILIVLIRTLPSIIRECGKIYETSLRYKRKKK